MNDKELNSLSVDKLEALIRHHNKLYWDQHKPEISDYEYDRLVNRLKAIAPDSPVLEEMGPSEPATAVQGAFKHKHAMLSLDKCYSDEELGDWSKSFEGDALMSPKFDGIAGSVHYNEKGEMTLAVTRGDGVTGENITVNAREIKDIPRKVDARGIEVRGEIFMRLSVFKKFKDEGFANPRNLAAGAIKQKDKDKSAAYGLSFAAYDLLGTDHKTEAEKMDFLAKIGFPPIERHLIHRDKLAEAYQMMAQKRASLDFEIDGVVFKVNSAAEQKRLGSTAHHPRYAIAYKFQGDSGTTTLEDIEWSVARSGTITPVALIKPVELSGAMVSRASLHHPGFIKKLGATKGCEVVVMRRGGVIPNVEFVSKPGKGEFEIPTKCPACGGPVRFDKDFLFCANPTTCKASIIGGLSHFAATTGMLGFGDTVLNNAYDAGILRRPVDFFTLTEAKLLTLDRMAEKGAKKLLGEVDKIRTLDLATFLRAFGLPELGKHVSALLADRYETLDRVYKVTEEELAGVHSIGDVIAKAVVRGIADARGEIEAVRKHVKIADAAPAAAAGPSGTAFAGETFVFTGAMATMERKAAEQLVKSLGGTALDAVNKTLTYLVVGDKKKDEKSTKQKAAEKLIAAGAGIKVVTESDFLARVEAAQKAGASAGPKAAEPAAEAPAAKPVAAPEPQAAKPAAAKVAASTNPQPAAQPDPAPKPEPAQPAKPPAQPAKPAAVAAHADDGAKGAGGGVTLKGKAFVFTGKLSGITLADAEERVKALGGHVVTSVDAQTTHLVVGAKGKPGAQLAEARARQGEGAPIEILDEATFVRLVGTKQPSLF